MASQVAQLTVAEIRSTSFTITWYDSPGSSYKISVVEEGTGSNPSGITPPTDAIEASQPVSLVMTLILNQVAPDLLHLLLFWTISYHF